MYKNGWILLLILLCIAFLVSCGKKEAAGQEMGELVRIETGGWIPPVFLSVIQDSAGFLQQKNASRERNLS